MLKLPTSAFALVKKLPAALSAALACLVLAGPAMAAEAGADSDADARQERAQAAKQVQAERKAARAEIAAQRAVIDRRRTALESECYQRFAVEDCLRQEIGRACVGKECRSRWSPYH